MINQKIIKNLEKIRKQSTKAGHPSMFGCNDIYLFLFGLFFNNLLSKNILLALFNFFKFFFQKNFESKFKSKKNSNKKFQKFKYYKKLNSLKPVKLISIASAYIANYFRFIMEKTYIKQTLIINLRP